MKKEGISTVQFISKLKAEVRRLGGPTKAALAWGVDQQRISQACNGGKLPGVVILKKMGYSHIKEINYRYKAVK
jgi:hypothetical protein